MVNFWHDLSPGPDFPRVVHAFVEIPKRSRNKYEYDKRGFLKLDRVLASSLHYPGDYGFVPQTLHGDGDPLDILVMVNEPTFAGCIIEARPLGVFHMIDKGEPDDKILAVPHTDPLFEHYQKLEDIPNHFLREVQHFFSVYKDLEKASVVTNKGWEGIDVAYKIIEESLETYQKHFPQEAS